MATPASKKPFIYAKTDFGPPPAGYIPGYGRGAVGFITRSDIGEAIGSKGGAQAEPEENLNENSYDNWDGYSQSLFSKTDYDDDDKEADKVYHYIDELMDERRKVRRQQKIKEELTKIQKEKPSIAQQFSDLKRDLGTVSYDEWESIPDAVDYSIKKIKKEKYTPVPDSVVEGARRDMDVSNTISVTEGASTPLINLNDIGSARGTILASQLDKQSGSVEGIKTVDKKGMLTALSSVKINSEAEIGDFDKVRKIMKSVINSNPNSAEGWIAAARIEELDGKVQNARNILHQGLKHCEFHDDIWLETARLEPPEQAKALLAQAVQKIPKSYKIWTQAAYMENDIQLRKKILKRALEHLPSNPKLWKELIEYEEDEDQARELLKKAVECVPGNIDMWLALAKLETYENARKVLNRARTQFPTEHSPWIAAFKLEEAQGKEENEIEQFIIKGIEKLKRDGAFGNRDDWIQEAEFCERSGNPFICQGVTRAVCFEGLLEQNKVQIILEDMKNLSHNKSLLTCRAMYHFAIDNLHPFQTKEVIDLALDIEIEHMKQGHEEHLDAVINKAVQIHSNDEHFWLKCTRDLWKQKDKARSIINKALEVLPKNENILLLASKLEREDGQIEKARQHLQNAHDHLSANVRTYKNMLKFELRYGNIETAYELAVNALKLFLKEEKILIQCAHIFHKHKGIEAARKVFRQGLEHNKDSVLLYTEFVQMEIRNNNFSGARPLLEKARLKIPKNPELLRLAVRLEVEQGNKKGAIFLLSKALKELPMDGELWSFRIELEPKVSRKKIINEALKQCEKEPYVYLSGAKLFWKERKQEKVRRWLDLSIKRDPQFADSWVYLYHFEKTQGEHAKAQELSDKLENWQLKKGRLWNSVRKSELGWNMNFQNLLKAICVKIEEDLSRIE